MILIQAGKTESDIVQSGNRTGYGCLGLAVVVVAELLEQVDLIFVERRFLELDQNRASDGVTPIQGTLRPFQHFDLPHVA